MVLAGCLGCLLFPGDLVDYGIQLLNTRQTVCFLLVQSQLEGGGGGGGGEGGGMRTKYAESSVLN